jgi:hypothetical protein
LPQHRRQQNSVADLADAYRQNFFYASQSLISLDCSLESRLTSTAVSEAAKN